MLAFRPAITSWKQPLLVRAAHQDWSVVVDVLVDNGCDAVIQFKAQIDLVLDVVIREHEQVGCLGAARLNEIFAEPDSSEIPGADWRRREDGDRDRELGSYSRLHR